jgi:tetratricopeptide (TPR) repeat protein
MRLDGDFLCPMETENYDIFLSYSRADARHAADIDSILRSKGLRPFFDRRSLAPGLPWLKALEQAIEAAKAAIVLIGPRGLGNTQQYERDLALIRQTRDPTFPVVPVILPETTGDPPFDFLRVLTWIDFSRVAKVSDAPDELEHLLAAVRGHQISAEIVREAICPYRGLDAFREEDATFFFGRGSADDPESSIGQLVRKVREHPFVMVVGRSGSGKSSLVYSGLLPALRRERDRFWNVLSLRPGAEPLRALAAAFNPRAEDQGAASYAAKITDEAEKLRTSDTDLLLHMIRQELDRAEGKPDRLLLYVDQWEELYAQAPPTTEKERAVLHAADVKRFIDLLLNAARSAPVTLVGTVRADFYDPLIGHEDIRAVLPAQQILLGSISRSELEQTIIEPAKKVGLAFDPPSLVQRILDEAGEDEGMLPLLQYALKETWALRKGNTMTADSYARSGGVREAIRITAERTFEALSPQDQQAARQLFLRLVTPGEGQEDTRARAAMPAESSLRKIVEQFAGPRTRLLVTGWDRAARPTVEVAHEALIRTWPRLRAWVDTNRERLRARAAVLQAKAEWEQYGRRKDLLLPAGFQLERGRRLLAEPGDLAVEDIQEFITLSTALVTRRNRIKLLSVAAVVCVILVGTPVYVYRQQQQELLQSERQASLLGLQSESRAVIADSNFRVAVSSAQNTLDQIISSLQHGDVSVSSARDLVKTIPDILGQVQAVRQTPETVELMAKLSLTLADLHLELGDYQQAYQRAKSTKELVEPFLAADPTNQKLLQFVYAASWRMGDALADRGNEPDVIEQALQEFRNAMVIAERLSAMAPESSARKRDMMFIHQRIGDIRQQQGDWNTAIAEYQTALGTIQHLVDADPNNLDSQRDLANTMSRLGQALTGKLDFESALKHYRAAYEVRMALVAAVPNDDILQSNVASSHVEVGRLHERRGELDAAVAEYTQALKIREHLAKKAPGNANWQVSLAPVYTSLGGVLRKKSDLTGALGAYTEALRVRKDLAIRDPSDPNRQRNVATILDTVGDLLVALNRSGDALRHYSEALVKWEDLARERPGVSSYPLAVFANRVKLADTWMLQDPPAEALQEYRKALEMAQRLAGADPNSVAWQRNLLSVYIKVGDVLAANGNREHALVQYSNALTKADELAAKYPNNAYFSGEQQSIKTKIVQLKASP